MIHHHIEGENLAVAIPERVHFDNFKELHAYLYAGGKRLMNGASISRGINGVVAILGVAPDAVGVFSGNPSSWINWFGGVDNPEEHLEEANYQYESGLYFEVRSVIIDRVLTRDKNGNVNGSRISRKTLTVDFFSDFIWDDESKKYRGINKTNSNVEVWDYDEDGNRKETVNPDEYIKL